MTQADFEIEFGISLESTPTGGHLTTSVDEIKTICELVCKSYFASDDCPVVTDSITGMVVYTYEGGLVGLYLTDDRAPYLNDSRYYRVPESKLL